MGKQKQKILDELGLDWDNFMKMSQEKQPRKAV